MNEPCKHHWILPPAGLELKGVCKHCGETKVFRPYEDERVFGTQPLTPASGYYKTVWS